MMFWVYAGVSIFSGEGRKQVSHRMWYACKGGGMLEQ